MVSLLDDRAGGGQRNRVSFGSSGLGQYERGSGGDVCGDFRVGVFYASISRPAGIIQLIRSECSCGAFGDYRHSGSFSASDTEGEQTEQVKDFEVRTIGQTSDGEGIFLAMAEIYPILRKFAGKRQITFFVANKVGLCI